MVIGTVDYMSPEQALGHAVDERSDIFSPGVVLYLLAAGRLPFVGVSAIEKIDRILHHDPDPITSLSSGGEAQLDRIIRKCLQKDRNRRHQTARELQADLRDLQQGSGERPPVSPRVRSRVAIPVIGAVVIVAAVPLMMNRDDQPRRTS